MSVGRKVLLTDIDLHVERGEWVCVIGPNGAGKSTLLRYLAGIIDGPGELDFDGSPAASLSRSKRARMVALVPQTPIIPEGVSVTDYVLLGRAPHIGHLSVEGAADLRAVGDALAQLDLLGLVDRVVSTLSGGERQRVFLARALAQEAPVLLLDEPTTALDVGHQQQVLELIEILRRQRDLTVISTMHDLTLAGQYADQLILIDSGRIMLQGSANDVLTPENLSRFFRARVQIIDMDGRPVVLPVRDAGAHRPSD